VLSPQGQLLVMKNPRGSGYNIYSPRTMKTAPVLSAFRTQRDAKEFAEALEGAGVPWNTEGNLAEWRRPDGAGAVEVAAGLRAKSRTLDPNDMWKTFAAQAKIDRSVPERLREPLLQGQYRRDGLGVAVLVRIDPQPRDEIVGILQGGEPDTDLATAARLREYGLDHGDFEAQRFALAAAKRLEADYRRRVPQPLDSVRDRFQKDFDRIQYSSRELARIDQILAEADATGNLAGAAAKLRALAAELRGEARNTFGSYGIGLVADVAGSLADALEHRAATREGLALAASAHTV
jgi:hypothetical protein